MLRLRSTQFVGAIESEQIDQPAGHVGVLFTGRVAERAHVEITVYVEDQESDAALLRLAEHALRNAVAALHHELATRVDPQSKPETS